MLKTCMTRELRASRVVYLGVVYLVMSLCGDTLVTTTTQVPACKAKLIELLAISRKLGPDE